MRDRASRSYTTATELANRLAREGGLPFRSAHRSVGEIVSDAIERGGEPLEAAAERWANQHPGVQIDTTGLDPAAVRRAAEYGGGPGPASLAAQLDALAAEWRELAALHRDRTRALAAAELDLERKVRSWIGN
jgi:argininosuccinate lyase